MRLICPNCGAQYEVDAQVIPESGRDVQCSNCGHTWFQRPASQDADLADELGMDLSGGAQEAEPEVAPQPEPEPHPAPEPEEEIWPEDHEAPEAGEAEEEPAQGPARRELDDGVLDILREEAERETEARRAEGDGLESQPDLGIAEGGGKRSLRDRVARLRGVEPEDEDDRAEAAAAAAAAQAQAKRRDLLPDIEEINSTLRAEDAEGAEPAPEDDAPRRRGSGFGLGFGLVVLIALVVVMLYAAAPRIVEAAPALEPALTAYVDFINESRLWLDRVMENSVARLTGILSQLTAE